MKDIHKNVRDANTPTKPVPRKIPQRLKKEPTKFPKLSKAKARPTREKGYVSRIFRHPERKK